MEGSSLLNSSLQSEPEGAAENFSRGPHRKVSRLGFRMLEGRCWKFTSLQWIDLGWFVGQSQTSHKSDTDDSACAMGKYHWGWKTSIGCCQRKLICGVLFPLANRGSK